MVAQNLTGAAVVTREGQLASVTVLREGSPDADLARAVSRLASGMRFVPARVRGPAFAQLAAFLST